MRHSCKFDFLIHITCYPYPFALLIHIIMVYRIRLLVPLLVAYLATGAQFNSGRDSDVEPKMIYTKDGGRRSRLGALFNACTNQPVPGFLWDQDTIERNTVVTNASFSQVSFALSDSLRDKKELMDINFELALSGMISVIKSFGYFTDKQRTNNAVRMTTKYAVRTIKETMVCG